MNNKHSVQLRKWRTLLAFAMGSILTALVARINTPFATSYENNVLLGLVVVYWILLGTVTGAWIILGRSWHTVSRVTRLKLGLAYLGVGWAGLYVAMMHTYVGSILLVALGIAMAAIFTAYVIEGRQHRRDGDEIFP